MTALRPIPFRARPAGQSRTLPLLPRVPGSTLRPEIKRIIEALAREAVAAERADQESDNENYS